VNQRATATEGSESRYETLEILYPTASSFYQEVQAPDVAHLSGGKGTNHSASSNSSSKSQSSSQDATKKTETKEKPSSSSSTSSSSTSSDFVPLHNTSDIIRQYAFEDVNLINIVVVSRGEFSEFDLGIQLSLLESASRRQLLSIKMAAANIFALGLILYGICLCRSYRKKVDITVYSDWSDNEESSDEDQAASGDEQQDIIDENNEYAADYTMIQ